MQYCALPHLIDCLRYFATIFRATNCPIKAAHISILLNYNMKGFIKDIILNDRSMPMFHLFVQEMARLHDIGVVGLVTGHNL